MENNHYFDSILNSPFLSSLTPEKELQNINFQSNFYESLNTSKKKAFFSIFENQNTKNQSENQNKSKENEVIKEKAYSLIKNNEELNDFLDHNTSLKSLSEIEIHEFKENPILEEKKKGLISANLNLNKILIRRFFLKSENLNLDSKNLKNPLEDLKGELNKLSKKRIQEQTSNNCNSLAEKKENLIDYKQLYELLQIEYIKLQKTHNELIDVLEDERNINENNFNKLIEENLKFKNELKNITIQKINMENILKEKEKKIIEDNNSFKIQFEALDLKISVLLEENFRLKQNNDGFDLSFKENANETTSVSFLKDNNSQKGKIHEICNKIINSLKKELLEAHICIADLEYKLNNFGTAHFEGKDVIIKKYEFLVNFNENS